jgi:hypothetical protein
MRRCVDEAEIVDLSARRASRDRARRDTMVEAIVDRRRPQFSIDIRRLGRFDVVITAHAGPRVTAGLASAAVLLLVVLLWVS